MRWHRVVVFLMVAVASGCGDSPQSGPRSTLGESTTRPQSGTSMAVTTTTTEPIVQCEDRELRFDYSGAFDPEGRQLTGAWKSEDGMLYLLAQDAETLWFVGFSGLGGPLSGLGVATTRVGRGVVLSDQWDLEFEWSDMPRDTTEDLANGTLTAQVRAPSIGLVEIVTEAGVPSSTTWTPCTLRF